MKKHRVFAYIESPYQVLGAFEYIMQHNVHVDWIIRKSNSLNNSQIISTLDFLEIDKKCIRFIPEISSKSSLIWISLVLKLMLRPVLLGDPGSKIGRFFLKKIILDDGTYNILYIRKFPRKRYWTIFDYRARNNFEFINLRLKLSELNLLQSDYVYFIGQPLSELNILSEQEYLNIIESFSMKYKLIYFPHRRESHDKIRQLEVPVHYSKGPLELELIHMGERPAFIIGFYSTALYTIKQIYGIESRCIKIDTGLKDVDCIYQFFEQNDLKICVE